MKNLLLSAAIAGPMAYVLYRSMSEYLQNEALTMFHEGCSRLIMILMLLHHYDVIGTLYIVFYIQ